MSNFKLEMLIKELCPNGVEYVNLSSFATISRGGNFQKKHFCESGIPCIHYGQIYTKYGLFTDKTITFISEETAKKQKFAEPNDIIMAVTSENVEDVCKCLAWIGNEKVAVSGHSAIIHHNQNAKYLCYYFHSSAFFQQKRKLAHGTKVIEVKPDSLKDTIIPLPPLEVQEEIVRILDNYSEKTTELIKELEARKKQYEFYRDKLLSFGVLGAGASEFEWKTIKDICKTVCSGGTPSSKNQNYYGGNIPWLRTQEVDFKEIKTTELTITEDGLKNSSAKWIPKNCVIVAMYGATVGKVAYTTIPLTTNQACCNLQINESIALFKYVYYWLANCYEYIKSLGQGSQTNINANIVKDLKIPVPPLSEQERIVKILDRFDKLCNDISEGLPAEIEARQKQYEYYRDKLLTFKIKE